MKRIYSLPFMTAAVLLGMTACSSSDDPMSDPVSPNESVKTSFTLSVGLPQNGGSAAAKPITRVSGAVAQSQNPVVFRGIDNISLIPFNGTITASTTRNGNNITLPNTVPNSLPSTQLTNSATNAKVYNDVNIPLGTADFLFYGKAIDASAGQALTTAAQQFQYGTITETGLSNATTPSEIRFTPKSIVTSTTVDGVASAITSYLNKIAGTTYNQTSATEGAATTSNWAAYATADPTSGLGQLYTTFTNLKAGSSASVEDAIQDLYASLQRIQPNAGSDEEALRNAIIANIADGTNASVAEGSTTLTFGSGINGYPGNINLPDGAATLTFANGAFTENTDQTTLDNGVNVAALSSYTYPVNLWYFVNTPIRTSNNDLSDQYANGTSWDNVLSNFGTSDSYVTASTRSIALEKQIQYAVGRLQTNIKTADGELLDRNGNAVTVSENSFPVTAILVGAQRPVDWQFQPLTATGTTQYTLYDKVPATGESPVYATSTNNAYNQTLVLESPSETDLKNVKIVVELQNNSNVEFTGVNGVIPVGTKFYLVADLDPTNTGHTGNSTDINQVFKQDYVTTANLTIGKNDTASHDKGLGAAYNVIPDLRTPVLSIGMSVDLTWQSGLTFDVDL